MRFFEETEQTRLEAQVSKGKIGMAEIALQVLQTWIFLNFFLKLFFLAFSTKGLLSFTIFENGRCQCHCLERKKRNRKKVVNPYNSLVWLLIVMTFQ